MVKAIIIPNDQPEAYRRKGYSEKERESYFNPQGFFREVHWLGWGEYPERYYARTEIHSLPLPYQILRREGRKKPFDKKHFLELIYEDQKATNLVRRIDPDIIIGFNGNWSAALSGYFGRKLGTASVSSVHDRFTSNESVQDVDQLICVSEAVRDSCLELGADPKKIQVIYEGIDLSLFCEKNDRDTTFIERRYPGNPKIFTLGRFDPIKNIERTLITIAELRQRFPNIVHLHGGVGAEKWESHYTALKNRLGLEGVTHFIGTIPQEQLPFYYSWSDLFFLPSYSEGCPNALLEALACGCAVITSNRKSMNEIIQQGQNGLLIDPDKQEELTFAARTTLNNPKLKQSLKTTAARSIQKYGRKEKEDKYVEIFRTLILNTKRK